MDADEIAQRIALLFNRQPDMSGRQINRLHGEQRRMVEDLAAEIAAENARLRATLAPFARAAENLEALAKQERISADGYKVVVAYDDLAACRAALAPHSANA